MIISYHNGSENNDYYHLRL